MSDILNIIDEVTQGLENSNQDNIWYDDTGQPKKYHAYKYASRTHLGTAGENICKEIFASVYPNSVCEIINKGKGEFDVLITEQLTLLKNQATKTTKVEVKTATMDVNKSFQFNGLRKDYDYDYAFLLGVAPEEMYFTVIPKKVLAPQLKVMMSKNNPGSYKYTLSPPKMNRLDCKTNGKSNVQKQLNKVGL